MQKLAPLSILHICKPLRTHQSSSILTPLYSLRNYSATKHNIKQNNKFSPLFKNPSQSTVIIAKQPLLSHQKANFSVTETFESILQWTFAFSEKFPVVSGFANGLSTFHEYTHIPWLVIIPSLAILSRTMILPFQRYSQKKSLAAITDEDLNLLTVGLATAKDEAQKKWFQGHIAMRKKALGLRWWNHGPGAIFAQTVVTIPIMTLVVFSLRYLAFHDPSLHTAGILWFVDLASLDPYWRFPWIFGLVSQIPLSLSRANSRARLKMNAEMSPGQQLQTRVTKNITAGLLYALSIWMLALIPILSRFPMASGYYMACSTFLNLGMHFYQKNLSEKFSATVAESREKFKKKLQSIAAEPPKTRDYSNEKLLTNKPRVQKGNKNKE